MAALTQLSTIQKVPSLSDCLCHRCASKLQISAHVQLKPVHLAPSPKGQEAEINPMRLRTRCLKGCIFPHCHSWNPDQNNASNKTFQKWDERKGKVVFILLCGWPASGWISLTSQAHSKSRLSSPMHSLCCFTPVMPRDGIIGLPSVYV